MPYATPPAGVMPVVDAPPTPGISLAPGGRYLALILPEAHPPVAMLARPYLSLAGIRADPQLGARRRLRRAAALSVLRVSDGRERALSLPDGAQVGTPAGPPAARRFAMTVDRADGVGLWAADAETGEATEIAGLTVCDVLGGDPSGGNGTYRWSRDGRSLLVLAAPAQRRGAPRAGARAAAGGDQREALPAGGLPGSVAHADR